jgi:hypothetical protein
MGSARPWPACWTSAKRAFPSREVEVISTAMAAVNSYALLDFADEIIAQQPDAVVIYVGHNEYPASSALARACGWRRSRGSPVRSSRCASCGCSSG